MLRIGAGSLKLTWTKFVSVLKRCTERHSRIFEATTNCSERIELLRFDVRCYKLLDFVDLRINF
jgi:hypothetical protein